MISSPPQNRPSQSASKPSLSSLLSHALARLVLRFPRQVLGAGLVVGLIGIALSSRLSLRMDLSELVPPTARSVTMLKELSKRLGGTGNVAIALEPIDGKPDALRAYIPVLAEALRAALGSDLLSIKYESRQVTEFYAKYSAWYVPVSDLGHWSDRLAEAIGKRENPAFVDLEEEAGGDAVKKLVDEVRASRKGLQPSNSADDQTGLLIGEGGKIAVVFVRPAANALNLGGSEGMFERIKAVVASTHPEAHGVRLPPPGYTGSIPTAITEYMAVVRDIVGTALMVCFLVGTVVIFYFRGLRELMLLSGALVIGAAVALGFAYLWIGHVNGQTAFLGAIIVGTGINYGIILLDRYAQAQRRGGAFEAVIESAIHESLRATWIAALATAVSFGVLAAGEVESFHQFGWIGGIGILACWLASFTFVPAMLVLVDRPGHVDSPTATVPPIAPRRRLLQRIFPWEPLPFLFRHIGRATSAAPSLVVAACLIATAAAGWVAYRARNDVVETNMSQLGTKSSDTTGIHKLDVRLRPMDDRSSTPEVVATADRAEAAEVCAYLLARAWNKADLQGVLNGCHTVADIFPRDAAARPALFARLVRDLDKVPQGDLTVAERDELTSLRKALNQPPPTDEDLPLSLREYFVERDGSLGKLAFVDPVGENIESNLYKFTDAIRRIQLPSGKVLETSGFTVVFADVLRAMRRDANRLTAWSAALVLLVLLLVTRSLFTFLRVGGALLAGVVLMLGVAVLLKHKLNFFNFVALPTTFGIGIDYGINIEERLRQRGPMAIADALAQSAPAVLLASLTSIFGYVSLLGADSRALSSFGSLAIIGEVACLLVAVTLIPALFALGAARRARSISAPHDAPPITAAMR